MLVTQCLTALLICFENESWTVRDAAIAASATIVDAYPAQSHPLLTQLSVPCFNHLADTTYNVRLNAAKAICKILRHLSAK